MELNEKIALVHVKPGARHVENLVFLQNTLRFRCQQCSIFCCRLGGPDLLKKDVERLEQAGYGKEQFLNVEHRTLRNRKDGSCIYLSAEPKRGLSICSVYKVRPTLCRLYPFSFEKLGSDSYLLKFIPCCKGINTEDGEGIDKMFFDTYLKNILLDLIDLDVL